MKIPFDSDVLVPGASSPTDVTAVQDGPTSIRVTWTPPNPLDGITGYRISFTGSSVGVSGGNSMSHTLTGLTNGETYTISVTTISSTGLPSAPVPATVGLGRSTTTHCSLPTSTVYSFVDPHCSV